MTENSNSAGKLALNESSRLSRKDWRVLFGLAACLIISCRCIPIVVV